MSIPELQILRTDVQNLLDKTNLNEVFDLVQNLPFCQGAQLTKYKHDFLNSHFPHNFGIYLQQLRLFLKECIDSEIARLQAIEKAQQEKANHILQQQQAEIERLEAEITRKKNELSQQEATLSNTQEAEAKKWFNIAYNATDLEAQISAYSQAIALNPHDAIAYYNRGNAKRKLGKYQEVIEDYTKAIAINPNYANAYCSRGVAKYNLGNYQEAIEDYTEAIALNPKLKEAYWNRALAYSNLKDKQGVLTSLREAIRLDASFKAKAKNATSFSWLQKDSDFLALVR